MRTLIDLPKLAKAYNVNTINVAYTPHKNDPEPTQTSQKNLAYYTLPINIDLLVKNKVWLAYDHENHTIARPNYIIGVGNHWLNTVGDDHRNGRLDITQYLVGAKHA